MTVAANKNPTVVLGKHFGTSSFRTKKLQMKKAGKYIHEHRVWAVKTQPVTGNLITSCSKPCMRVACQVCSACTACPVSTPLAYCAKGLYGTSCSAMIPMYGKVPLPPPPPPKLCHSLCRYIFGFRLGRLLTCTR